MSNKSISQSEDLIGVTKQNDANLTATVFIGIAVYVITGVLQPLVIDSLRMNGLLGRKWLLLPTLANTSGMASCGLLVSRMQWKQFRKNLSASSSFRNMILLTAGVDLLSGMLLTGGILLTGGAIFVVLYNSCPAWTALLSRYILGRSLNRTQVMGVLLVSVGLASNVLGSHQQQQDEDEKASTLVLIGSLIVLLGSFLHSLMFILSDLSLRNASGNGTKSEMQPSISGELWCCCLGTIEAAFMSMWVLIVIYFKGFYSDDEMNGENDASLVSGFLILLLIDALHAAAFFALLKNIGAVGSALLKGIQAVAVVITSAIFFCPHETSQCLTFVKTISMVLVLSGVLSYAAGTNKMKLVVETRFTDLTPPKETEIQSLI